MVNSLRSPSLKSALKSGQKTLSKISPDYSSFQQINGLHPYQQAVRDGHVSYLAYKREKGKVIYFNFDLAKEMGLIPEDHPHEVNEELAASILETFNIQIINEYDILNVTTVLKGEIKENPFMCTRYLQLQHPDKKGRTSGDGRSLWNGTFQSPSGEVWDISSCGTGATCLSPATHIYKKFFKTGDPNVSYGCGLAEVKDGLSQALMSEIFHRNQIRSERALAVIEYAPGLAINVRAGKNLLRPGHLFLYLKQNDYDRLKESVDYFIGREIHHKKIPVHLSQNEKYLALLDLMVKNFAAVTAKFERDYVFCWMDWDGDNILCDGGIIDYGSIRQFGLFHWSYRYDDVERMSTNLIEQKDKARYIIQTFIQMVDFLMTGKRKSLKSFGQHKKLNDFDQLFEEQRLYHFLEKMGFEKEKILYINQDTSLKKKASELFAIYHELEKVTDGKGPKKLPDGEVEYALFNMRSLLRELPQKYSQQFSPLEAKDLLTLVHEGYSQKLLKKYQGMLLKFQEFYLGLIWPLAQGLSVKPQSICEEMAPIAYWQNYPERITGDGAIDACEVLFRNRHKLTSQEFHRIWSLFLEGQTVWNNALKYYLSTGVKESWKTAVNMENVSDKEKKIFQQMMNILHQRRLGL